jgi:outer membrane protein assembly factor BamB
MNKVLPFVFCTLLAPSFLIAADLQIDWQRAQQLFQREQRGETLTPEERGYLDEAKRQRASRPVTAPGGGNFDWVKARALHERAERGEKLTPDEQKHYDEAKRLMAAGAAPANPPPNAPQRPPAPPPTLTQTAAAPPVAPVATLAAAGKALPFDWPQWRGPARDDLSKETGLLKQWPAEGPQKIWSYTNAGQGYSAFAIVAGRLFTNGTREGSEVLICLDAGNGQELWTAKLGGILDNKWGDGPRGTPTVDGDRVYTLGGDGTLVALQVKDGKELWRTTMESLGGKRPNWGYTESVLVDGKQVVCTPGGPKGALAAFDKMTGKPLWQSAQFTDGAQYSSIVPATINGEPQYVQRTMESVVGISPQDGKLLWKQAYPGKTAVIPTPIVKGNQVYVTAGYGVGSLSFVIEKGNTIKMLFDETSGTNKVMKNHHGGVILVGDHLYGYSDGLGWTCQDFESGALVWNEKAKLGKGAIAYADGSLYLLDEATGTVALIEASPAGYKELSRFKLDPQTTIRSPQGRIWTHPVISNGKLYLRDQDLIFAYAVK